MNVNPHLHISVSHVEKLADLLVLLLPSSIFPLTKALENYKVDWY
jgi:hypothetical protein